MHEACKRQGSAHKSQQSFDLWAGPCRTPAIGLAAFLSLVVTRIVACPAFGCVAVVSGEC